MAGPWEKYGGAPAPAQPPGAPVVVGTPRQKAPDPLELERLELSRASQALSQKTASNQQGNQQFDNISNLRKEYNALPEVKDYSQTLNSLAGMWKAPDNAQGDLGIIYGFAKVMDPGSVVREGEMDMANSTSSYVQDLYRRYGQIADGNRLPAEVRKQLIATAMAKGAAFNHSYKQQRGRYETIAKQFGVDPTVVLGPHAADAYRDIAAQFDAQNAPPISNEQLDAELKEKVRRGESPAAIIKWLQDNGQPLTDDTIAQITANQGNPAPQVERDGPNERAFKAGVGDLVEGTGDLVGLIGNPLNAGINAVAGTNLSTDLGQTLRDATGLPEGAPLASAINKGGVAALGGAGIARAAAPLLSGVGRNVAGNLAAEPLRQTIAGATGGASAEIARQNNIGPLGQLAAGVVGGVGGYGGTNALLKVAGGSAPSEIAQIAGRQGVDLMPQDVGGATTRRITASAAQTPLSAEPIVRAAKNTQAQLKAAAGRAEGMGALPADDAGEAVRRAGRNYVPKQSARIGRVYDRAEERAKGVSIKPVTASTVIDEQIAKLSQLGETNKPLITSLQKLKSDIAGGVKVSGLRDARTSLSQGVYDGKLRSSQEKQIYRQVIDALSGDIEAGLSAAGRRDALNLFRTADKAWKERIDYIDEVLEPVIGGKKSGEEVLSAIERMGQGKSGGVSRLAGIFREMPEDVAGNVRATIIERLGKAKAGQQDASGEGFSSNEFLTNWSRLSPKGKAILFGESDLRRNLDEIAKLAGQVKESSKFANSSNTSGGVWGNVGALGALAISHPKVAIAIGSLQYATGRLMASKAFTSWLARVPNNPALMQRHEGQLAQIAAREPLLANDIASVQQYLNSTVNGVSKAAASGADTDRE